MDILHVMKNKRGKSSIGRASMKKILGIGVNYLEILLMTYGMMVDEEVDKAKYHLYRKWKHWRKRASTPMGVVSICIGFESPFPHQF